jgi:hypothetical protein
MPELQHLHLLTFGTDLAIYFCALPRLCPLGSYEYAEFGSRQSCTLFKCFYNLIYVFYFCYLLSLQ